MAGLIDGAEPFIYDISGVAAAEGVTATSDPAGCKADLIINSNVLEHVGFPRILIGEILNAAPKDGLVYIEVLLRTSHRTNKNSEADCADWNYDDHEAGASGTRLAAFQPLYDARAHQLLH